MNIRRVDELAAMVVVREALRCDAFVVSCRRRLTPSSTRCEWMQGGVTVQVPGTGTGTEER